MNAVFGIVISCTFVVLTFSVAGVSVTDILTALSDRLTG